jgi:DamX protein
MPRPGNDTESSLPHGSAPRTPGSSATGNADVPLEEQLRALGLGERDADVRLGSNPGVAQLEQQVAALTANLEAHRSRLRDLERSLVERIADVDDDRRRANGQLQRAIQSQADEWRASQTHGAWRGRIAMLLIALAAGTGLFLLWDQVRGLDARLGAQTAQLREEIGSLVQVGTQDAQMQSKLASLSAVVGSLSKSIEALAAEPTAPPVQDPEALVSEIDQLRAEQSALRERMESALASAPSAGVMVRDPLPANEASSPTEETPSVTQTALDSNAGPTDPTGSTDPADTGAPQVSVSAAEPYALQLIGFYDLADLRAFAARDDLSDPIYLKRETLRGQPWFVLIHSLHANVADARSAVAALAPDLAAMQPWIRELPVGTSLELLARTNGQ